METISLSILRYLDSRTVPKYLAGVHVDAEGINYDLTLDPCKAMLVSDDELFHLRRFLIAFSCWEDDFRFVAHCPACEDERVYPVKVVLPFEDN